MPAYNAAKTLKITYHAIPHQTIDQIILVDDSSLRFLYTRAIVAVGQIKKRVARKLSKREKQEWLSQAPQKGRVSVYS